MDGTLSDGVRGELAIEVFEYLASGFATRSIRRELRVYSNRRAKLAQYRRWPTMVVDVEVEVRHHGSHQAHRVLMTSSDSDNP